MGFDLYGLNPDGDIPKPVITDWEDKKQTEAYFAYQDGTPGSYFRTNVWFWRPLWQYVTVSCDDILTEKDMEEGEHNSGHRISKTKANRIASRLKKLPKEECHICNGEGIRNDEIGKQARNKNSAYTCNGCDGKGVKNNFNTHYPFESDVVMRFAEFCKQSGGFEIC
mgnify:CR=1 FL=1